MTRADAAAFIAARYAAYLTATGRAATDTSNGLAVVIDDALLALGYAVAGPTSADDDAAFRASLAYATMAQVVRDLGATFSLSTGGDSLQLYQMRQSAEKDLALAEKALTTTGAITGLDLNYLDASPALPAMGVWSG